MKVSELIQRLQAENPHAEVHAAYNYGDYARTTVAPKVRYVEEVAVIHSKYHSMPKVVDEEDDDGKGTMSVVLFT